eukprot:TRINITY_DN172_c0_g1_i1.p1 TRINITY_DN172_c0_g1~~TRINITY_DN172_c0_g1_i1.p1  ORF type:complete len:302 (-),score=68.37 TRINITY_DN172_c0_g1_i1:409-1314(-)
MSRSTLLHSHQRSLLGDSVRPPLSVNTPSHQRKLSVISCASKKVADLKQEISGRKSFLSFSKVPPKVTVPSVASAVTQMATSDKIQLYSLATPNGQKVSVALEEMGLEYEPHTINIMTGDQFKPEFVAINPNSKIPAIVDPNGPGGKPLAVFESGAILMYLAEKSGKFLPKDERHKWETIEWVFFQMGGIGPMFGQFGHFFKYAKDKCKDPYPLERYTTEAKRLLGVLEKRLEGREFLIDAGYTIADMAIFPWLECLMKYYQGEEQLELAKFPNVMAYKARCLARPAVQKGMNVCPFNLPS